MAQLTIYVESELIKKIERAAKREKISRSKWVSAHLEKSMATNWPADYFSLFGSVSDLERPSQGEQTLDKREKF